MNVRARRALWPIGMVATTAAMVIGCSGDGDPSGANRDSQAAPAGSGASSTGAGSIGDSPFGNPANGTATDTSTMGNTAGSSGSTTPPEDLTAGNACGIGMLSAKLTPVNMLVMFGSGSDF